MGSVVVRLGDRGKGALDQGRRLARAVGKERRTPLMQALPDAKACSKAIFPANQDNGWQVRRPLQFTATPLGGPSLSQE
jgi:hypothetical protein